MPATQIMIADTPPNDAAVTVYDRDHLKLYMRLLDANDAGATLEEIASMNIEKLKDRKDRDMIHGSGDER